jgi:hypothetical protein
VPLNTEADVDFRKPKLRLTREEFEEISRGFENLKI